MRASPRAEGTVFRPSTLGQGEHVPKIGFAELDGLNRLLEVLPDDATHQLTFGSRHKHDGSGLKVRTRHMMAALWHKPMDKSGRKARGEEM